MNVVFTFPMQTGQAAVALEEVLGVVPDLEVKNRCLIISSAFPEGLTAEKAPSVMIGNWIEMLEENEQELEDDLVRELENIEAELADDLEDDD
tara:strand:+ start:461 stop:739 length:279 start_codon:yes stop_codon:yes gene_type:complete